MFAAWLLGPAPAHCTVELEGVPASLISSHKFVTAHRTVAAAHRVSFELVGDDWLRLVGPRYTGLWRVSPDICRGGLMKVKARPRNARVHFHCPPQKVAVRCTGCDRKIDAYWHLAESFPSFKTAGWHQEVEFELKAVGFYPMKVRAVIHPGDNVIDVHLEPRQ
jgi:hypothetical protein